jgi:hypothetical protein
MTASETLAADGEPMNPKNLRFLMIVFALSFICSVAILAATLAHVIPGARTIVTIAIIFWVCCGIVFRWLARRWTNELKRSPGMAPGSESRNAFERFHHFGGLLYLISGGFALLLGALAMVSGNSLSLALMVLGVGACLYGARMLFLAKKSRQEGRVTS